MARELVTERLREADRPVREFLPVLPQMIDHAVGSGRHFSHLCGLIGRHVQNLHAARRNLHLMIVEVAVPLDGRQFSEIRR